jgi:hypothetical protein
VQKNSPEMPRMAVDFSAGPQEEDLLGSRFESSGLGWQVFGAAKMKNRLSFFGRQADQ